jgi:anthranilate phosphoribosyltransferase
VGLLNAAAALVIADEAKNLRDGVERAFQALDSGAAKRTLERLVQVSNA